MLIQNIIFCLANFYFFLFANGIDGCHEIFSYIDSISEFFLLATLVQFWGSCSYF